LLIFISLYKFSTYWFSCLSVLSFQLDLESSLSFAVLFALLLFSVADNKLSLVMIWFVHLIHTTLICASQQCHSCNFLMNKQKYLNHSACSNASYTIIMMFFFTILRMNKFSTHCALTIVCSSFVSVILLFSF